MTAETFRRAREIIPAIGRVEEEVRDVEAMLEEDEVLIESRNGRIKVKVKDIRGLLQKVLEIKEKTLEELKQELADL